MAYPGSFYISSHCSSCHPFCALTHFLRSHLLLVCDPSSLVPYSIRVSVRTDTAEFSVMIIKRYSLLLLISKPEKKYSHFSPNLSHSRLFPPTTCSFSALLFLLPFSPQKYIHINFFSINFLIVFQFVITKG